MLENGKTDDDILDELLITLKDFKNKILKEFGLY